jgi:decaprenyl-phosphate phosphoribosyltransferase
MIMHPCFHLYYSPVDTGVDVPARARRDPSLAGGLVRTARPKQWVKNVLVLAAPGAAGVLDQGEPFARTLVAFACLCLAASGTYFLNDAADVEVDRAHPTKRARPIAAGIVPVGVARVAGVALVLGGIGLGFAVRWELALTVACYVAVTTLYTSVLKHVAVLDIVAIASGFVLRAVAGAAATDVPISDWFFIVASFGSLFMVTGKRTGEATELGDGGSGIRATLGEYTTSYLAYLRSVSSGVVLVAYCLWAFEKSAETDASIPWFQLTIPLFAIAILRYALLVEGGKGSAPEELVLEDRTLLAVGAAWSVVFALGIYAS